MASIRLRACIHRGAAEIGGSCVEVECDGKRLVVDIGLPLETEWSEPVDLPPIRGLDGSDPSLLGVVISHSHPDHYGLLPRISDKVPVLIGAAAERVLQAAAFFTPAPEPPAARWHLNDREAIDLAPFRITPYLVDHSAFDAYAITVDAGGRRLMYSGDLRAHGRKRSTFERLLASPPARVDALLLEGTTLSRVDDSTPLDEESVETQCAEVFREANGVVLAAYSPQNVDRLVSIYKAARRTGRTLVLDLYAAAVAEATGLASIPQASWAGVRVFVPQSQRVKVKRSRQFERIETIGTARIHLPEILANPERYVLTFRASMARDLADADLAGAQAIWSMWPGYLETSAELHAFLESKMFPLVITHASGHASVADLKRFAAAIAADRLIPIHTAVPELYSSQFDNVEGHPDGEWWDV